jgi:hypothetical protein
MMTNIENNGAPWQYNQQDRLKLKMKTIFQICFFGLTTLKKQIG